MGVPKRKVSKARQGERRAHLAISAAPLVECEHCHELHRAHRPEIIREKGSDSVRTVFAGHLINEAFAKLGRHPRMIEPVAPVEGQR